MVDAFFSRVNYFYTKGGILNAQDVDGMKMSYINGHQTLAKVQDGKIYYYIYNSHGDVIKLVDKNGNVVNEYSYDVWGITKTIKSETYNDIRYTGQIYDEESGNYYLRARYYNPQIKRFISRDGYEGTLDNPISQNRYIYCLNSPLIYFDPTGNNPYAEAWAGTMWWLTIGDGPLPIADGIYLAGILLLEFGPIIIEQIALLIEVTHGDIKQNLTLLKEKIKEENEKQDSDIVDESTDTVDGTGNDDFSSWNKGSFDSAEDSLDYHFDKHGDEVNATSREQYQRKAEGFKQNLRGATKSKVDGAVEGTVRYVKNGKYIDIAPDGTIVSFGKR